MFPDVNFLVYHSGFIAGQPEGPYDPKRGEGIDELIRSVEENGSRATAMSTPSWAAPGATPCAIPIPPPTSSASWSSISARRTSSTAPINGSPQDQIQAFRTFQISEAFQEKYGYAKMTRSCAPGFSG